MEERESTRILRECIELQNRKSRDYQNDVSTVKQADYYVNGVSTIYDIMWAKMLRVKSLQDAAQHDPDHTPNFEGLQDSVRDLINYASFYAAYLNKGVPGQIEDRDMFNREITKLAGVDKGSPEADVNMSPAGKMRVSHPNYREIDLGTGTENEGRVGRYRPGYRTETYPLESFHVTKRWGA